MSDTPDVPDATAPTRHVPPSGLRVTLVLVAIITGITLACVSCVVGYMFYVDLKQA